MKGIQMPWATIYALIFLLTVSLPSHAANIPEPGQIIYGTVGYGDRIYTTGTVYWKVNGEKVASAGITESKGNTYRYVLRIPMDSNGPKQPGTVRKGDRVDLYFNNLPNALASLIIGEPGSVTRLSLIVTDQDEDGLADTEEDAAGTDPDNPDTDGDGLPDGWEVKHGLDPMAGDADGDSDNDGISNAREFQLGTDPKNADTDGDGCTDKEEIGWRNPLLSDAGGDVNDNCKTNLNDTQAVLDAMVGISQSFAADSDVDSDGVIGLAEGVYGLQKIAGFRDNRRTSTAQFDLPEQVTVSLTSKSGTVVSPDQTIQVAISVSEAAGISGCAMTLLYPKESLTLADHPVTSDYFTRSHDLRPGANPYRIRSWQMKRDVDGEIALSGLSIDTDYGCSPETGKRTIFTVSFKVKGTAPHNNNVTLQLIPTTLNYDVTAPVLVQAGAPGTAEGENDFNLLKDTLLENVSLNLTVEDDTDGDGVPDSKDEFPYDTNESVDTDYDGEGNNTDTDDDGDGMPDAWEIAHGLNPLVDDATDDLDGDGANNKKEFDDNTDPTVKNSTAAPQQPGLLSPADGQVDVTLPAILRTGNFADPERDKHIATIWQISDKADPSRLVFATESQTHHTRMEVPAMVLEPGKTYFWRVQFKDGHGAKSVWSDTFSFTLATAPASLPDSGNTPDMSDLDGNGTPDISQTDLKVLSCKVGQSWLALRAMDRVDSIDMTSAIDPKTISVQAGKPETMPWGLVGFKLKVETPGDTGRVQIFFSESAPTNATWHKFNPLKGWIDFTDNARFQPDRRSVVLSIKDGGIGDADGIANGIIIDPSGLSTPDNNDGNGGNGGTDEGGGDSGGGDHNDDDGSGSGCFLNSLTE